MERAFVRVNPGIENYLKKAQKKAGKSRKEAIESCIKKKSISYVFLKELFRSNVGTWDSILYGAEFVFPTETCSASTPQQMSEYSYLVSRKKLSMASQEAVEWREGLKELSLILNGLFSVIGAGAAVFFVLSLTALKLEWRILSSIFSSLIVVMAELFLLHRVHYSQAREEGCSRKEPGLEFKFKRE